MQFRDLAGIALVGLVVAACNDTTSPPPPPPPSANIDCGTVAPVSLAPGEHQIVDPATSNGCVRVPAAGAGGAEYLVVAASTARNRTSAGVSGAYVLRSGSPSATAAPEAARGQAIAPAPRSVAREFDAHLRRLEAALVASGATQGGARAAPPQLAVPQVGDTRTFKTCSDIECDNFTDVAATAKYVGTKAAIYLDDNVPQNDPLTGADFQDLGRTFDTYHYPIDTDAFGAESDIDGNGRIVILMTDAVNALTPDCANGRVLGYFFGLDLITTGPDAVNSNKGEVFYTLVPSPATAKCSAVSRQQAIQSLRKTLIHELQHMISWNQHVLIRSGPGEETWLNEAMSHFAEELGGRLIPNSECINDGFTSCRSQYISDDIINSYDYSKDPEARYLVAGTNSTGTLEERGAGWFFLRWVLDQFAAQKPLATDLTRKLEQTNLVGVANIEAQTGGDFSRMVPEWLLSIYLDDLPGFTPASPRLQLDSWGLRSVWTNPQNQAPDGPFEGFPLVPDSTSDTYSHSGTLRAGSGTHLRLIQPPNGDPIDVQLVKNTSGTPIDAAVVARLGIARVR
jgi:hypothetical protein